MKNIKIWDKFWRLTIKKIIPSQKWKWKRVISLCDCGNNHESYLFVLINWWTKSCWCLRKERMTKHSCSNLRGKKLASPEYCCWQNIRTRCYKEKYRDYYLYWGRGITVCDRWKNSFINFLKDMWPRPWWTSIDRIDVNGNYEPWNCKWSNVYDQAKNKRNTIWITYDWKKLCLAEWSRILWIHRETIHDRIYKLWWSVDKALSAPVRKKYN